MISDFEHEAVSRASFDALAKVHKSGQNVDRTAWYVYYINSTVSVQGPITLDRKFLKSRGYSKPAIDEFIDRFNEIVRDGGIIVSFQITNAHGTFVKNTIFPTSHITDIPR